MTNSDLPYPEGVACAEVLKVGAAATRQHAADVEHGRAGLLAVLWGSIVAAVFFDRRRRRKFSLRMSRRLFAFGWNAASVSGYDFSLRLRCSRSVIFADFAVGFAMLVGALIGWGWGVPHYSALAGDLDRRTRRPREH